MQLSDADKKLVARLKERQRQFIRWRWVGLVVALLCIGVGGYGFVVLDHFAREPELPSVIAIAFLSPLVFLLQAGGFGLLIYLVAFWHGKPETRLLLRLLEDSRDANSAGANTQGVFGFAQGVRLLLPFRGAARRVDLSSHSFSDGGSFERRRMTPNFALAELRCGRQLGR